MHVAFVHPDLGLGGAERLVIDAALSLLPYSHTPTIYTPFHDPSRSFPEVCPPNQQLNVNVLRTPFPRTLLGRFHAALAALRCALVALYVCLFRRVDVAVVDLVALPVLVFALFRKPVVFYCHYPDTLLAASLHPGSKPSPLVAAYRRAVDTVEVGAMRCASAVVCNSRFTARVFASTFPDLPRPTVIYPCVQVRPAVPRDPSRLLLSLNRYERKKSISLAVETLAVLRDRELAGAATGLRLVIAGGYDARLPENVEYFAELERLVAARGLGDRVRMLRNVDEAERRGLLRSAAVVLYTPSNEHFGIVPLEAMAEGVPVVAVKSGGPVESVESGVSGMLCESSAGAFAEAVEAVVGDGSKAAEMGRAGRERVAKLFSREVLGRDLQNVLMRAVQSQTAGLESVPRFGDLLTRFRRRYVRA